MQATLAGAFTATGAASGEALRQRVARTLGGAASHVAQDGPLAVGLAGHSRPAAPCVLAGSVFDLDDLAAAAGLPGGGDPAVVLHSLFRREGEALFERLSGDFVLVVWDQGGRAAWVVRDRMGGAGLHWCERDGAVLFATEIADLLRMLPSTPAPDTAAVAHWLALSPPPEDRTLYAGVRSLAAGSMLRLETARSKAVRYWWPRYQPPLLEPPEELVHRVRSGFTEAVRRRCGGADTGILLSGGLDSSSVAAVAMRALEPERRPRTAYSAVFPLHTSVDEGSLIDLLTTELGLASSRVSVSGGSVLTGALPYLERWRLPPQSPNLFFWEPLLRRAAADGAVALMDGEGGDELFRHPVYLLADYVRRGRFLGALRVDRNIPGAGSSPPWRSVARFMREYGLKGATPLWFQQVVRRMRGAEHYAPEWFLPATARAWFDSDESPSWKRLAGPRWWAEQVSVLLGRGAGQTLDHVRLRAAAAGLDARHPLMDVDLVELVLRLPPETAFDPRHSRPMLRACVAGILPDQIRLRPHKSSFDAVFHESLRGPDLQAARRLLCGREARTRAYARPEAVQGLLHQPPTVGSAVQGWAIAVWRLATLECWLRELDHAGSSRSALEGVR